MVYRLHLGFNIPYLKSGLKKWWFWQGRFISSVWSVTHMSPGTEGWLMSACVLFMSVWACSWDERGLMKETDRLEMRTESRMCERRWEVVFLLMNADLNHRLQVYSAHAWSMERDFNSYKTCLYLSSLITGVSSLEKLLIVLEEMPDLNAAL